MSSSPDQFSMSHLSPYSICLLTSLSHFSVLSCLYFHLGSIPHSASPSYVSRHSHSLVFSFPLIILRLLTFSFSPASFSYYCLSSVFSSSFLSVNPHYPSICCYSSCSHPILSSHNFSLSSPFHFLPFSSYFLPFYFSPPPL